MGANITCIVNRICNQKCNSNLYNTSVANVMHVLQSYFDKISCKDVFVKCNAKTCKELIDMRDGSSYGVLTATECSMLIEAICTI